MTENCKHNDCITILTMARKSRLILTCILCFLFTLVLVKLQKPSVKKKDEVFLRPPILPVKEDHFTHVSLAAKNLPLSGKLFCLVISYHKNHQSRAMGPATTWMPKCDHGEIFTNNNSLPETVPYRDVYRHQNNTYYSLYTKMMFTFHYIYTYVSPSFDWYLKADDDTYVIVENLLDFIKDLNPNKPYYIGFRLKSNGGYNSGGAGYILSRPALKLLADQHKNPSKGCVFSKWEDLGVGKCLRSLGVAPMRTMDKEGLSLFYMYSFDNAFNGKVWDYNPDYWLYEIPKIKYGFESFSSKLISIHHTTLHEMRLIHTFLYRVKVH
ncbi:hypothetical protein L596_000525 [Steinernema carpocapsae]|uniref:N-acetylgalactosaminide beta-1,3-galactosyltransferase n=2 Tax=Steinernema carpocapsae TaxID=34508 RepID=A0A4U8UML5_STECR|nr:hypothetical protein L596_000525 [Steinernema carpocapsae]